jgi:ribonuclease R
MPQRYLDAIIKYLSSHDYMPLKPRQLARQMGVTDEDYTSFRQAIKTLRDSGRIILGAKDSLMLPQISDTVVGTYRANPRGFGFLTPDTPNAHGDLYVPEGETGGAMSGDTVKARVFRRGSKAGETIFHGRIIEIIRRGSNQIVGTLQRAEGSWFLLPDGKAFNAPVLIADVGPGAKAGQKIVAEITQYPEPGQLARGVIVENLGASGAIAAETESIIRAQGLPTEFDAETLEEARLANASFDPHKVPPGREDLTGETIVTIRRTPATSMTPSACISATENSCWACISPMCRISSHSTGRWIRKPGCAATACTSHGVSSPCCRRCSPTGCVRCRRTSGGSARAPSFATTPTATWPARGWPRR